MRPHYEFDFFDPLQNIEKIWRALSPPSVIANEVKRPSLGWFKIILVVFFWVATRPAGVRDDGVGGWYGRLFIRLCADVLK